MTEPESPTPAEQKVIKKYKHVYSSMLELMKAIQYIEPGGVLTEDIAIRAKKAGGIQLAYAATPIQLTIATEERTFTLKIVEHKA